MRTVELWLGRLENRFAPVAGRTPKSAVILPEKLIPISRLIVAFQRAAGSRNRHGRDTFRKPHLASM